MLWIFIFQYLKMINILIQMNPSENAENNIVFGYIPCILQRWFLRLTVQIKMQPFAYICTICPGCARSEHAQQGEWACRQGDGVHIWLVGKNCISSSLCILQIPYCRAWWPLFKLCVLLVDLLTVLCLAILRYYFAYIINIKWR